MIDLWKALLTWLQIHDLTLDLITVWALALGFGVLATVNVVSWWTLRNQHDRTPVGKSLKQKKAAEAVICAVMAILYGLTLYAYYDGYLFGFWERFWLRLIVIAGIVCASVFGIRFVRALRAEDWGRP